MSSSELDSRLTVKELMVASQTCGSGELKPALDAALVAWRSFRHPRLASCIEAISALLTPRVAAVSRRTSKQSLAKAFSERTAQGRSEDVGPLAAFLRTHLSTMPALLRSAAELGDREPDPRVAALLLELFFDPPYTDSKGSGAYRLFFELLVRIGDPRAVEPITALSAAYRGKRTVARQLGRRGMSALHDCADALAQLPEPIEPSGELAEALVALERAVEQREQRGAGARESREELFAAVYEDPEADDPRLVLADYLQEQGDPRGEFIALQCDRAASGRSRVGKHERELLSTHGRNWLGPLDGLLLRKGLEYRRGFVAAATFTNEPPVDKAAGVPEWATMEELHHGQWATLTDVLVHPVMRALRAVRGLGEARLIALDQALRQSGRPERRWTTLGINGCDPQMEGLVPLCELLPALRRLEIHSRDRLIDLDAKWFFASPPLGQRLVEVALRTQPRLTGGLWPWIQQAPALTSVELAIDGWMLCLQRDAPDASGWHASAHGNPSVFAGEVFGALSTALSTLPKDSLRTLSVTLSAAAKKRVQPEQIDALRRSAEAFSDLEPLTLPTV